MLHIPCLKGALQFFSLSVKFLPCVLADSISILNYGGGILTQRVSDQCSCQFPTQHPDCLASKYICTHLITYGCVSLKMRCSQAHCFTILRQWVHNVRTPTSAYDTQGHKAAHNHAKD